MLYLLWQADSTGLGTGSTYDGYTYDGCTYYGYARACVRLLLHCNMHMVCHDMCMLCVCLVPERGFLARLVDDLIAQLEPASGHEAYHDTERQAWAHPEHPTRDCPFDMWARKVAAFGANWC